MSEYAEDAVHTSGDFGVMALAVRQDTQADFGADGDYTPLSIDADGALRVSGGGGGTQYATGADQTTPTGTVALGHDGASVVALAVDNSGQLQVDIVGGGLVDDTGTIMARLDLMDEIATSLATLDNIVAGNEAQVDIVAAIPTGSNVIGQVTANAGTNLNTSALALESGGNLALITDDTGTIMARLDLVDEMATSLATLDNVVAGNEAQVDIVASLPAGTNAIGKLAANSGVDIGDVDVLSSALPSGAATEATLALIDLSNTLIATAIVGGEMVVAQDTASSLNAQVVGNVAHDSGVSGNPLQIAGEARSTERTAVASADVSRLVTDLAGKLITLPYANPEIFLQGREETTGAGGTNELIAAQGASTRIYVTSLIVSNASATNTEVNLQEGDSTTLATIPAPTVGGAVISFPVPIKLTENTALGFSASDAVSTITVTALGYSGA